MDDQTADLVVCGGGMTGVACAVSAARRGMDTWLIERQGCLGGVATSGLVNHLLGGMVFDPATGTMVWNVGGLFRELTDGLIARGQAIDPLSINRQCNPHGWFPSLADGIIFDNESMKAALDQLCLAAGVHLLFLTEITGVEVDDTRIKYITLHNKDGKNRIGAACFADTTGDADIAAMSGCRTVKGREGDGLMAPASLEMHVDHVDTASLTAYIRDNGEPRFRQLISHLRKEGIWNFPYDILIAVQLMQEDVYMINTLRQVGIDGTDAASLTRGLMEGRAENQALFAIMQQYFPGFAHARIRQVAPAIGIRETRRICGRHNLSVAELQSGAIPQDSIAVSSYGWDLPDPKRPSVQPMADRQAAKPRYTHIPYGCLLPEPVSNLVVAGRSVSVERDILGPVRVMAPCMAMGQAAGTAAALLSAADPDYTRLDIDRLQAVLVGDGCIIRMGDKGNTQ